MLLTTTTLLSQRAAPSPLWFGIFPKRGIGRGITSIFRVLCDTAKRGCASHVPPSPGAPHERGAGGGSDPPFFAAGAAPASVHRRTQWRTINTPLEGGRSFHSDPCGKAIEPARKSAPRTVKPGSGRGDGSSPGGDRGGPGACGPEPGRGGLCSLGPVRTPACPDGRLGALLGPGEGGEFRALRVKRPVDPAGGVENPGVADRDATSLGEGFPHLLGRAWPAHSLHRLDGGFLNTPLTSPRFVFCGGVQAAKSSSFPSPRLSE